MDINRNSIQIESKGLQGQAQALMETELEGLGNLQTVLSAQGKLLPGNLEVLGDAVSMDAIAVFFVLYVQADGSLASNESRCAFSHTEELLGANATMKGTWDGSLRQVQAEKRSDGKLALSAVVDMDFATTVMTQVELVTNVENVADIQIRNMTCPLVVSVNETVAYEMLHEELLLPNRMPACQQVLGCFANVAAQVTDISADMVGISGEMTVTALYVSAAEPDILQQYTQTIPVETSVSLPQVMADDIVSITAMIEESSADWRMDDDGEARILKIEVTMRVGVTAQRVETVTMIADLYSPSVNLQPEKVTLPWPKNCRTWNGNSMIRESVSLPVGSPPVGKIIFVNGQSLITGWNLKADMVQLEIEGIIDFETLYLPEHSDAKLAGFTAQVPFSVLLDVPEIMLDAMDGDIDLTAVITTASASSSDDMIDYKSMLVVSVKYCLCEKTEVLTGITLGENLPENQNHGIILYFVKPNDTIWEIARRFHTTLEQLTMLNPELSTDASLENVPRLLIYMPKSMPVQK